MDMEVTGAWHTVAETQRMAATVRSDRLDQQVTLPPGLNPD